MKIIAHGARLAISICAHRLHELGWDREQMSSLVARSVRRGIQILYVNGSLDVEVPGDARSDDVLLASYLVGSARAEELKKFMQGREELIAMREGKDR